MPFVQKAHLCKFSLEEAQLLSGKKDLHEASDFLHEIGAKMIGKLTSPSTIKYIMGKYDFKFSKGLRQNFLISPFVVDDIVYGADITAEDGVLEIGPGIGVMTQAISQQAKKVVAVEIAETLLSATENLLFAIITNVFAGAFPGNIFKSKTSGKSPLALADASAMFIN